MMLKRIKCKTYKYIYQLDNRFWLKLYLILRNVGDEEYDLYSIIYCK